MTGRNTERRPAPQASKFADRKRYERIIEKYLSDCYARRTAARASELAQLLEAPRSYISAVIQDRFGKPLHLVLREGQLREAIRLLRIPTLTLNEIAEASAFGHRSTFFRIFRQAFGMTPAEYRKRLTKCDFTQ